MKKYLLFSLILCANFALAQLNVSFNDGNLTSYPEWTGSNSTNDFTVLAGQLRSNSVTANSNFHLITVNNLAVNSQWEFWVNLQFNPSSANYVDVYLTSNQANLQSAAINGYFVRIGNTNDEICLFKRSGTAASSVKLIDGADGILNTSNNKARIRVTRNANNLFTLERDITGLGTSYVAEGTVQDADYTSSAYFGIFVQQSTSSFHQKHFFDDFKISALVTDNVPPKLLSATVIDSTTIEVVFDEVLDSVSAKQVINYAINNGYLHPASVKTTADPLKYHLKLSSALITATYQLSVSNIKDKAGNTISTNTTVTFSYNKPFIAKKGDIVINEIFADPSPQIDLPSVEFIELYNASNQTIALKNWRYSDPVSNATFSVDSIKSAEYLILCAKADTNEFKRFGKTIGISPWPSLNNSSDMIKLVSPENLTIDSVAYSDSWHLTTAKKQGGWSLERINYSSRCGGVFNWRSSTDNSGGTPGKQNSIFIPKYDQMSFKIDSISKSSDSTLNVYFNKPANGFAGDQGFSLNPGNNSLRSLSVDTYGREAKIIFNNKFSPNTTYQLAVSLLKDCAGNTIQPATFAFTTPKIPPLRLDTATIYITEIFADPSPEVGLPLVEFVEIFNPGKDTIDLEGWTLNDATTKGIFKKAVILPNQFLIVCPEADTIQYKAFGKAAGLSQWPSLNNSADQISLKSFKGRVVDNVSYQDSWYKSDAKKVGGWSLELIDLLSACNSTQNWIASNDPTGGTPGRQNSVYQLYKSMPLKITSASVKDSITVLMEFNHPPDSLSASNPDNYLLNNGMGKPMAIHLTASLTTAELKFPKSLTPGKNYKITSENITDCSGFIISSEYSFAEVFYPHRISQSDILINEVLFNPRNDGVDFVEIYNNSAHVLDLKDLHIATIKSPDSIANRKVLTATSVLLPPKQYLVLTTDPDNIKKEYLAENADDFLKIPSIPAFNNDKGSVVLLSGESRIDQLNYSEKMHFGLIKDPKGVSLERTSFIRQTNEAGNFRSAAASVGYATPGYKNSQAVENTSAESNEISLLSKTFSPDSDGFEDALQINYHFTDAGTVANVSIYNDKGMLIKKLAKNVSLAAEGAIVWDGMNDNNQLATVGIYIVYVDVFNLTGQTRKYKQACVLAAKFN